MENKNGMRGCGCESEGCNCGGGTKGCMCGWCRGGRHHVMKIAIVLIVLAVTFWAGVKIGELKAYLHGAGYGRQGMMRFTGTSDGGYGAGGGMMRGYWDNSATSTGQ